MAKNRKNQFDPDEIGGDLAPADHEQANRLPANNTGSHPIASKAHRRRSYSEIFGRGFNGVTLGNSNCFDKAPTPLAIFASVDCSAMSQDEAKQFVRVLQPIYRKMENQPKYIKNEELKASLAALKHHADTGKLQTHAQRYQLKTLAYQLAFFMREGGDIESSMPNSVVIENLTRLLARQASNQLY